MTTQLNRSLHFSHPFPFTTFKDRQSVLLAKKVDGRAGQMRCTQPEDPFNRGGNGELR
jgi:hypothetical protein